MDRNFRCRTRRSPVSTLCALALGVAGLSVFDAGIGPAAALAASANAPESPGTPAAPTTVYTEDFENVSSADTAITLSNYTGAGPLHETCTADPAWLPAGRRAFPVARVVTSWAR